MHRFFVKEESIVDSQILIEGEDHLHITKSLRMKLGDKAEISDGKRNEYIGEIVKIGKEIVLLDIIKESKINRESHIDYHLYQGMPKGSKMDLIVQKAVELGVNSIMPVITHRTLADIDKKGSKKVERWQKISEEAAKQSKRAIIPKVQPILNIKDLQSEFAKNQLNLIAYEDEVKISLKDVLYENQEVNKIGVFIGPEGGLALEEVEYLKSIGGVAISLGKRILRTETAGLAVLSMLLYHFEL